MRTLLTITSALTAGVSLAAQGPVPRTPVQLDAGATGALSGVSIDGDGSLIAAGYYDGGTSGTQAVSVVASVDGGVTWGAPVQADRDTGAFNKLMTGDSVRVAGSNVYAVWKDARVSTSTDDLYFNYSTDGGASFQVTDVALDDGAAGANEVFDWRFEVNPDPTGDDLYVLFSAEIVGGNTNEEVFLVSSLDGGVTWSSAVKIGGDDAGDFDVDQIALAVSGTTVHMAWEFDEVSPSLDNVLYQRTTDAGMTLLPSPIQLDSSDVSDVGDAASSSDTGLKLSAEGVLVVAAWPEERTDGTNEELRVAVSINDGQAWGADVQLGGYNASSDDIDACTALVTGGNIYVAWDDNRDLAGFDKLYVAVSTNQGATFTETEVSGPLGGSVPRLAGEGENVVVNYTSESGTLDYAAAAFTVDSGATWSGELQLSDNTTADSDSTNGGFALSTENALSIFLNDLTGSNGVYASGFALCDDGAAVSRNAGSNPASLTADVPLLGALWNASVDLTTTGHAFAGVVGFASQANVPLPGGQVLLVNVVDSGGELLGLAAAGGSPAMFSTLVPIEPGFCNFTLSIQAVHFGSVAPYALSNAIDLTVAGL